MGFSDIINSYDDEGVLRGIREGWTDLGEHDPFVVLAAGRACFQAQDLVRLTVLIDDIRRATSRPEPGGA